MHEKPWNLIRTSLLGKISTGLLCVHIYRAFGGGSFNTRILKGPRVNGSHSSLRYLISLSNFRALLPRRRIFTSSSFEGIFVQSSLISPFWGFIMVLGLLQIIIYLWNFFGIFWFGLCNILLFFWWKSQFCEGLWHFGVFLKSWVYFSCKFEFGFLWYHVVIPFIPE